MKGNAYDSICVVFDHDNRSNRGEAYTAALQAGFGIAFSSMAFEYWYLLHFVQTTRPFPTGADLIKELKKHYPNYEKGKQNDFNLLKPFLEKANANAIWSRGQMEEQLLQGTFLIDLNPYTDVDLLVGFLVGLK